MKIKTKFILASLFIITGVIILKKILPQKINEYKIQKELFWVNKTHSDKKANIIVAGDSRIYRGFSIKDFLTQINKKTTALNLGYSSAGFGKNYFDFIDSKIVTDKNTKIIILGITPNSLTLEASLNKHFKDYNKKGKMEIFQTTYIDPNINFSPYTFYEILKTKNNNSEKEDFHSLNNGKKEHFDNLGWIASTSSKIDSLEALKSYRKSFSKKNIDSIIVNNLFVQIKKWNKEGIKVFCFRPPTTKHMVDLENELSGFNENKFKLKLAEFGGVWINVNQTKYLSYDGSHLDYLAAKEFSKDLGKLIKPYLY